MIIVYIGIEIMARMAAIKASASVLVQPASILVNSATIGIAANSLHGSEDERKNKMKTLKEIIALEKSVADMLSELTCQIAKATSETSMDGVKIVTNNIASVNVMSLDHSILCPSYYIQSAQADMVERKLREAKTATEFINKIQSMIDEGKVKVNGNTIRLNPKTVEILRSYLDNV